MRDQYASLHPTNSKFRQAVDEVDNIIWDLQENGMDTDEMIDYSIIDDDTNGTSSIGYNDAVLPAPNDPLPTSDLLLNQITEHLRKMWNATQVNYDRTEDVQFELVENQPHWVTVARIPGDGNCLFGTFVHQLFGIEVNSFDFVEATEKLREDVVRYISNNFHDFEAEILARVFDEEQLNGMENIGEACQFFLNEYLSRDGYWGADETIKAIQLMYRVNILVFKEPNLYNYFQRFDEPNTRMLILMHRLGNRLHRSPHNHYDSVCRIHTDDILNLVEFLANGYVGNVFRQ